MRRAASASNDERHPPSDRRDRWRTATVAAAIRVAAALSSGCEAPTCDGMETNVLHQAIVYGTDSRRDVGDEADPELRRLAMQSSVTLMTASALAAMRGTDTTRQPRTLRAEQNLCVN